jgi:hypothetical protein
MFGGSHANKLAPRLKALADSGLTLTETEAAKEMEMESKRARLIARENSIKFLGPA